MRKVVVTVHGQEDLYSQRDRVIEAVEWRGYEVKIEGDKLIVVVYDAKNPLKTVKTLLQEANIPVKAIEALNQKDAKS
jgi:cellobiose-specific phosphotransferase system component IIB